MAEEPKNQQPQRKGSSFGFVLSLLLVIGIIVTMSVLIFGNMNGTKTINEQVFVEALMNDRVYSVNVTPKEETVVVLNGSFLENKTATKQISYTVTIDWQTYNDETHPWAYKDDKTGATLVTDYGDSIRSLIIEIRDDPAYKLVEYKVTDPYVTSWWDTWGPTIIMLGASLLIVIFLFSRLAGSVGSSNRQAMDFNKSRARREINSKVRFNDVAGRNLSTNPQHNSGNVAYRRPCTTSVCCKYHNACKCPACFFVAY